jgi:hypothetical protein
MAVRMTNDIRLPKSAKLIGHVFDPVDEIEEMQLAFTDGVPRAWCSPSGVVRMVRLVSAGAC